MSDVRNSVPPVWALVAILTSTGFAYTSWIARVPELRIEIDASYALFGGALLAESIGAVVGTQLSRRLSVHIGSRRTILFGVIGIFAALTTIGASTSLSSATLFVIALMLLGLGFGLGDVALNVVGAEVERRRRRSVLPLMHGMFSAGCLLGSAGGTLATALHVPLLIHLTTVASAATITTLVAIRVIPQTVRGRASTRTPPLRQRPSRRVLLLILVAFCAAFAEGAANGWSTLALVEGHGLNEASGAATFTVFLAALTLARLGAARVVNRIGRPRTLLLTASLGVVGLVSLVLGVAIPVGTILLGMGTALGFPLGASAAGDEAEPELAVSRVTSFGYIGYLAGPVFLGGIAEHFGPIAALSIALLPLLITISFARALRPR